MDKTIADYIAVISTFFVLGIYVKVTLRSIRMRKDRERGEYIERNFMVKPD